MSLSLTQAMAVVQKALDSAGSQSVKVVAVAVDMGGHVVAQARMDGVSFINAEVARRKATLAAAFATSTQDIQTAIGKDPVAGPVMNADPQICLLPGGMPIMEGDVCVGGIGIAGGFYLQDHAIAQFAAS